MYTLDEAIDQFAYHPATPDVSARYAEMRNRVIALAEETWDLIPNGPEKTTALRGLQQFLIYGNLAIALTTPADLDTPHVARVLPDPSVSSASTIPSSLTGSPVSEQSYADGDNSALSAPASTVSPPDVAASEPQPTEADGTPTPTPDSIPDGPPAGSGY